MSFSLSRFFFFFFSGPHTVQLWLGKIPQNGRMRKDKQGRVAVGKECWRKLEPINTRVCDRFSLLSTRDNEKDVTSLGSIQCALFAHSNESFIYFPSLNSLLASIWTPAVFVRATPSHHEAAKHCGCSTAQQWAVKQKTNGIISSVWFHLIICCMLSDNSFSCCINEAGGSLLFIFSFFLHFFFFFFSPNVKTTEKQMPGWN